MFFKRPHALQADKRGMAALEFALLAPALLSLAFGVIVYSIYFTAVIGVRQAASEGARAAVAGLSSQERASLARLRAGQVLAGYGSLMGGSTPQVTAAPDGMGVFKVTVSYDITGSPIMRYGAFVPLPDEVITASVMVTNGGY
jgi:Flp pilus assembly protein TadG